MTDMYVDYMGLRLKHPVVVGASPLSDGVDDARRLEDAGAAAIVLPSLFEEWASVAQSAPYKGARSADEYVRLVACVREAVAIPVVASLNGTTMGGWLRHASLIEEAGASALEMNVYRLAADPAVPGGRIELETIQMVAALKGRLSIPLAVKLSPEYTSLAHFAQELDMVGANGLVLFNRFYQPDLDLETGRLQSALELSTPLELRSRLRWLAILSPHVRASLAATGGVHSGDDAAKAILAGATVVQVVSAIMREGLPAIGRIERELRERVERSGKGSVAAMRGALDLRSCDDPSAYERANYISVLRSADEE